ncbi:MAG: gamma-glutamyl-gamma-aminobutyrate hydrolase family protein [Lachnospiraceae bacterium]
MQNQKPLIALTPYFNKEEETYMRPGYLKAILAAGGIPVTLGLELSDEDLAVIADTFDGFIFTGGPDVHPFYFGEETHSQSGNVCLKRDIMELALLPLVMARKKPVLGICRGIQVLNIGLGGDIYQDIPSQFQQEFPIAHAQPFAYDIPSHRVTVTPGTLLSEIAGGHTQLNVNSMHHQAVRKPAPGLVASGHAASQLIEAVEKPDYPFFLGVQWHPEYLWQQDGAAAELFASFVRAAHNK